MAPAFAVGTFLGITFGIILNPILGLLIGITITALFLKLSFIEIEFDEDDELFI